MPEQQAAIKRMQTMRAEGASLRAIAGAMKVGGHNISHVGVKNALEAAA